MFLLRIVVWILPLLCFSAISEAGSWNIKKDSELSEIKQGVALAGEYDTLFIHEAFILKIR